MPGQKCLAHSFKWRDVKTWIVHRKPSREKASSLCFVKVLKEPLKLSFSAENESLMP